MAGLEELQAHALVGCGCEPLGELGLAEQAADGLAEGGQVRGGHDEARHAVEDLVLHAADAADHHRS